MDNFAVLTQEPILLICQVNVKIYPLLHLNTFVIGVRLKIPGIHQPVAMVDLQSSSAEHEHREV